MKLVEGCREDHVEGGAVREANTMEAEAVQKVETVRAAGSFQS